MYDWLRFEGKSDGGLIEAPGCRKVRMNVVPCCVYGGKTWLSRVSTRVHQSYSVSHLHMQRHRFIGNMTGVVLRWRGTKGCF